MCKLDSRNSTNQLQRGGGRAPQTRDNGAGEWKVFSPADYKNEAFETYYKVSLIYLFSSFYIF